MKLTSKMKGWLRQNAGVVAGAPATELKKAVARCLMTGELSVKKYEELSKTEEDELADDVRTTLGELKGMLKSLREDEDEDEDVSDIEFDEMPDTKSISRKGSTSSSLKKLMSGLGSIDESDEDSIEVRVKEAAEQYSTTKSALRYPMHNSKGRQHALAGEVVRDFSSGRALDEASERDRAIAGAWSKYIVNAARVKSRSIAFAQLPQHDKELVMYALQNEKWGGSSDGGDYSDIKDRRLTPSEQKALIDDSTSGGLEAAPIVFDDMVIQAPLLNGELYPLVNTIPLDRGRRIEGVSVGKVTGSWNGVDSTAISLFDTASYVSAFDTTIFRWQGAVRVGLDFLSDSPIDFGRILTDQYGERLLEDLDDVIATGDGTTQPEGITVKTGATSVAWGGTTTLGNYESLRFGVHKREHTQNLARTAVWVGTETSYQRARAIPVGASDARRLGGMDYSSYQWMERPFKINETMGNTKVAYCLLGRYRMYRRRGLTIKTSQEGDTLIRNNEMLMVATARYGGQLERGAVCARTTTAPS